jgi:hypothetical protein
MDNDDEGDGDDAIMDNIDDEDIILTDRATVTRTSNLSAQKTAFKHFNLFLVFINMQDPIKYPHKSYRQSFDGVNLFEIVYITTGNTMQ